MPNSVVVVCIVDDRLSLRQVWLTEFATWIQKSVVGWTDPRSAARM